MQNATAVPRCIVPSGRQRLARQLQQQACEGRGRRAVRAEGAGSGRRPAGLRAAALGLAPPSSGWHMLGLPAALKTNEQLM